MEYESKKERFLVAVRPVKPTGRGVTDFMHSQLDQMQEKRLISSLDITKNSQANKTKGV